MASNQFSDQWFLIAVIIFAFKDLPEGVPCLMKASATESITVGIGLDQVVSFLYGQPGSHSMYTKSFGLTMTHIQGE